METQEGHKRQRPVPCDGHPSTEGDDSCSSKHPALLSPNESQTQTATVTGPPSAPQVQDKNQVSITSSLNDDILLPLTANTT